MLHAGQQPCQVAHLHVVNRSLDCAAGGVSSSVRPAPDQASSGRVFLRQGRASPSATLRRCERVWRNSHGADGRGNESPTAGDASRPRDPRKRRCHDSSVFGVAPSVAGTGRRLVIGRGGRPCVHRVVPGRMVEVRRLRAFEPRMPEPFDLYGGVKTLGQARVRY
jgi:hypothetical protein